MFISSSSSLNFMGDPDFIVGIIGNVISLLLCFSPMRIFLDLLKKKSAENYDALPYISALLCKTLWTFYGILDPDGLLIITVNSFGMLSNLIYVFIYLIYAPSDKKVKAMILVGIMNVGIPGMVMAVTVLAFHGISQCTFIGVVCAVVTIAMYAAPLSIMVTVIQTKSVEYMPILLSIFLLLNAGSWLAFSIIVNDYYVMVSNAIGILSSSVQVIIYIIYKDESTTTRATEIFPENEGHSLQIIKQGLNLDNEGKTRQHSAQKKSSICNRV